MKAP
ncbi:hypothetical protein D030_0728A, partial [Vibrio parahaemolyticus AQ3810]|jgi:hypothetical protein